MKQAQKIQRCKIVRGSFRPAKQLDAAVFPEQQFCAFQLAIVVISHGEAMSAGVVNAQIISKQMCIRDSSNTMSI